MTRLLTFWLGRLPIGWLQLVHNRPRLVAAIAGVAFADVLIFMQLGFMGALMETTIRPYRLFDANILVSASDANTLYDGGNLPRQRLFEALAAPGVSSASPLYVGKVDWTPPEGDSMTFHVLGVDPRDPMLRPSATGAGSRPLSLLDTALVDLKTRGLPAWARQRVEAEGMPVEMELNGRTIDVVGGFEVGAGFEADGYLIMSDDTFLSIFRNRSAGAPSHLLLRVAPGADAGAVAASLPALLSEHDTVARTIADAAEQDRRYQTTERPVGVVFGFGVVIGMMVGIIIVYQVLSTDVADHLAEYATLKAIGYPRRYFLSIVFEEAAILAVLGFIPGLVIALGLYRLASAATDLPILMDALRPALVLAGTTVMCAVSGAIATRRLASADPADLF